MPPKGKVKVQAHQLLPDDDVCLFSDDPPSTGRSVPLITFDASTGFAVNPDALALLADIPSPISVVAVAGLYRTGKSFLLNRIILAKQNAFTVGPTTRACTKGIWMWSEPLLVTDTAGRTVRVIVVDTEGIGAPTADASHDTRIFALGLLIATFFIYNSVGSIDEQALSNLSLVTNVSKQIKQSAPADGEDAAVVKLPHYPSFLWVVRDFALQLQDQDGKSIGANEYLEDALKECAGTGAATTSKNRVRLSLREFFPERACFTLVRPCTQENQLQNLDCLPNKSLRPEFVNQAGMLRQHVFHQAAARPSRVNGVELNGSMLGLLCQQYVTAINAGQVPVIQDAWTYVCDAQRVKEEQATIAFVLAALAQRVQDCTSMSAFDAAVQRLQAEAIDAFTVKCDALAHGESSVHHSDALSRRLQELCDSYRAQFALRVEALMSSAVNGSIAHLSAVLADRQVTVPLFKAAVQEQYASFVSSFVTGHGDSGAAATRCAEAVWYSALQPLLWRAMTELGTAQEAQLRAKHEEVEQLRESYARLLKDKETLMQEKEREMTSLRDLHEVRKRELEEDVCELQQCLHKAREQVECKEAEVAQLHDEKQRLEQALVIAESRAGGLEAELGMLRDELQDVAEDAQQLQAQTRALSETQLERDRLRIELAAAQRELETVNAEFSAAEELYKRETKDVQAKALQSIEAMKEARRVEKAELSAAKQDAESKCVSLEAALAHAQDDVAKMKRKLSELEQDVSQLRAQLHSSEQGLVKQAREHAARTQEMERAHKEKERGQLESLQQLREDKLRLEQELIIKVQQVETRALKAEAGEAEKKRQLDLAEERWQRKRARTDDDGDNKSLQLIRAESELTWLRRQQAEMDAVLSTLRKDKSELEARVRQLERNQDSEVTRVKLEYEHQIALLQRTKPAAPR
jgi:hypothetical protein